MDSDEEKLDREKIAKQKIISDLYMKTKKKQRENERLKE